MGIVYYSRYFEYFEIGRVSLLRANGFPYSELESKFHCFLPVIEATAKFHNAAKFEDELIIKTMVKEKPTARLRFDYEIYCNKKLITDGFTTHPFLNGVTCKPGHPPKELKALFDVHFS
jgi:acyl-CoA thioester hydrolase